MLSRMVSVGGKRPLTRFMSSVQRMDGPGSIVVLDFAQIQDREADISASIEAAYSANGHGIVAVKGVPDYVKTREALLPLAFRFANFEDEVKAKYEVPEAFYAFGWSHGKEKLEGKPDWSKGSFYNNPLAEGAEIDPAIAAKFPAFYSKNVWPDEDLPELRKAFLDLGSLISNVGFDLAAHCDKYVLSVLGDGANPRSLEHSIRGSKACKGRLLHYFPEMTPGVPEDASTTESTNEDNLSSWCGWHNDHGSLTGLAGGGMYFDRDGNEVGPPNANAGLYIKSRAGNVQRVVVPRDYMAFQIGETAQVHSGGVLQATPHCVSAGGAASATGVSRSTFAIFMEPEWDCPMDLPAKSPQHPKDTKALVPGVPDLAARWKEGQNFAEFNDATLEAYY